MKNLKIFGDSIIKGVTYNGQSYHLCQEHDFDTLRAQGITVENNAKMGATIDAGLKQLDRKLGSCDGDTTVLFCFGGNDCDFRWKEIAEAPEAEHLPNVPLPEFVELYRKMIRQIRSHGIRPILTNLPPLDSERFFNWWCGDLDQKAVLRWLGDVGNIYAWQERYSRAVERLAREEHVPLVDVRGAFLDHGHLEQTLCADGTHPNTLGQGLITQAFQEFGRGLRLAGQTV